MEKRTHKLRMLDTKGFSLIEVLAAFMIIIMASQILLLGISYTKKINSRTAEMEMMRREAGIHLYKETDVVSGTVRMELSGGEVLEKPGLLYTGEKDIRKEIMTIIWVDEPDWSENTGE